MLNVLLLDVMTILALPFLLMISWWRRSHPHFERRILIIQLGKIGDMICTTPLFRAIHNADSALAISVLCLSGPAEILQENPCVHDAIILNEQRFLGFSGRLRLCRMLLHKRFDITLCVLPGTFNAILGLWSCAPRKLHVTGGRIGLLGRLLHLFFTDHLTYKRGTRTYDHYMKIAEKLGYPPAPYNHEVYVTDAEQSDADRFLEDLELSGKTFAVLSLTAGNPLKEWPLERFIILARYLIENHAMTVLFSSSDTQKTARALKLLAHPEGIDIGGVSLRRLAGVIRRASLFVSVDTGPLYIAHAFRVPLIDIVGPVDPREQPPIENNHVTLVRPPSTIQPSSFVAETLRVSNEEQRAALDAITVDDLRVAIQKIMPAS